MRELLSVLALLIEGLDPSASTVTLDVPELPIDEEVMISRPLCVSSDRQTKLICPAIHVRCPRVTLDGLEIVGIVVLNGADSATIANCHIHCPDSVKPGFAGLYVIKYHGVAIRQTSIFEITGSVGLYLRASVGDARPRDCSQPEREPCCGE
jgi:hypothetical protein